MAVETRVLTRQMQQFSKTEIDLLRKTIAPETNDSQLALFVQVCSQLRLNPFARQIYAIIRNERQRDGSYEKKMTIQTSIDGYRLLAQRSGEYAGQDGPYWYDPEAKTWEEVWLKDTPPVAAKVGVMRKGFVQPMYAVARFKSYAACNKDGSLSSMWAKMPDVMIAKVAEALALRRAFPAELSGIYTAEEMSQADNDMLPIVTVEAQAVEPEPVNDPESAAIKERMNELYKVARELRAETHVEKPIHFLALIAKVLHVNRVEPATVTMQMLDHVAAYLMALLPPAPDQEVVEQPETPNE